MQNQQNIFNLQKLMHFSVYLGNSRISHEQKNHDIVRMYILQTMANYFAMPASVNIYMIYSTSQSTQNLCQLHSSILHPISYIINVMSVCLLKKIVQQSLHNLRQNKRLLFAAIIYRYLKVVFFLSQNLSK